MSYLVLARRWRPQTFEQIRGQDHIVRALRNAITSGRIAHAYVFTGIRGVGKTSAARVLAKALNCVHGPTPTPCNECESCLEITEGKAPDVLEIDGASNTGVDDVRKLREAVRYPPVRGRYRVYIIDEVHMLSTAAFNALLKTLEEPPPQVVFVFATTDAHKIPVTILSRCQQYDFKRLSPRELVALLSDIAAAEGISIEDKGLIALAREADGSVRDAQSLLDQVISFAGHGGPSPEGAQRIAGLREGAEATAGLGGTAPDGPPRNVGGTISAADVRDVLGAVDRDCLLGVAHAVVKRDPRAVLDRMAEAERFGYDVRRFSSDLQDIFRDFAVLRGVDSGEELVDLAPEEVREARDLLSDVPWEETHALFDMLSRGIEALRTAPRPGVILEMTLLKMARLPPVLSLSEVLAAAGSNGSLISSRGAPGTARAREAGKTPAPETLPRSPGSSPAFAVSRQDAAGPGKQSDPASPPSGASPETMDAPAVSFQLPSPASPPKPHAEPKSEPVDKPVEPVDGERLWAEVLRSLEVSNRPFWTILRGHASLHSWDPAKKLAVVAFDDPAQEFVLRTKQEVLLSAFRDVAGRETRVELRSVGGEVRKPKNGAADSDRARMLKKEAMDHPLVRQALEIFDGDVEEVRALKP